MKKTLIAIILDIDSQKKVLRLLNHIQQTIEQNTKNWTIRSEHVTLVFGVPSQKQLKFVGESVKLTIDEIGYSDKAIAAKVVIFSNTITSDNKIAHITMAFDPITGNGGIESKNITHWIKIPNIYLNGTVKMGHNIIKRT